MPLHQRAAIYDYDGNSTDEDGEVLLGFYWQLLNDRDQPTTRLMGPFPNYDACYKDCDRAFQANDY